MKPEESFLSFRLKVQDQLGIPYTRQKKMIPGIDITKRRDKIRNFDGLNVKYI